MLLLTTRRRPGVFRQAFAALLALALFALGLMFSLILAGVAVVLGVAVWAWLRWKMRRSARQFAPFAEQAFAADAEVFRRSDASTTADDAAPAGRVIEGEVISSSAEPRRD